MAITWQLMVTLSPTPYTWLVVWLPLTRNWTAINGFAVLRKQNGCQVFWKAVSTCALVLHFSDFRLSVERNSRLLWFWISTLIDWFKNSRHFLDQSEVKPKPIVTCSHAFSRAFVAATCICFLFLLVHWIIFVHFNCQSKYGFTTLNRKVLYSRGLYLCFYSRWLNKLVLLSRIRDSGSHTSFPALSTGNMRLLSSDWLTGLSASCVTDQSCYVVCLPFTKKSGNFGWYVNGKTIWFAQMENFPNIRDVLKGSPKFPAGKSERKMGLPFGF